MVKRSDKKSKTKKELSDNRLKFEILLSDISAHFINIPWQDIDENIKRGLRSIVEFLGFDRGSLFQLSETGMVLTHSSAAEGFEL